MKNNSKCLEAYFKKASKKLGISSDFLMLIKNLFQSSLENSVSDYLSTSMLKTQNREDFTKIRAECLQSFDVSLSFVESTEADIQLKFESIKKIEKDIEKLREKASIIEIYEDYMADNRKPNFFQKIETISYFKNEKLASIESLNSLLIEKQASHQKAETLAEHIQTLYKEIEEDQAFLTQVYEALRFINDPDCTQTSKKLPLSLSSDEILTIPEILEEGSQFEISSINSKEHIHLNIFSPEIANSYELCSSNEQHKGINLKIKNKVRPVIAKHKPCINSGVSTNSGKIKGLKIGDHLSRNNQERLALIEEKLRYGEAFHGLLTPTLERMKRMEVKAKNYFSVSPRIPDSLQIPGGYKKQSPKPLKGHKIYNC